MSQPAFHRKAPASGSPEQSCYPATKSTCSVYRYPLPCISGVFWLRGQHLCHTPSIMLAPVKTASWWQKTRRHSALHPRLAIDAPAVRERAHDGCRPQHNLQSALSGSGSRGTIWMTAPHPEVREDGRTPPPVPCPHREYVSGTSLRSSDGGIPAPVTTAPGWLPLPCSRTG